MACRSFPGLGADCVQCLTYVLTYVIDRAVFAWQPHPSVGHCDDLTAFVDDLRRELRGINPADSGVWREAYERGITTAYARGDIDGLVAIATFAGACLDSQGFHDEALDQLTYALDMAGDDPNPAVYLLSARAVYEAAMGDGARARESLHAATARVPLVSDARARLAFETYSAVVTCMLLQPCERTALAAPIRATERHGFDWFASALKCWLVCYLVAQGEHNTARPWVESLRLQAKAVEHPARVADASVFAAAERAIAGTAPDADDELCDHTLNYNALWRSILLRLRHALLTGRWAEASRQVARAGEIAPRLSAGFTDGSDAFEELLFAYRDNTRARRLNRPRHVGLLNLAGILAGVEAVSITGTQSEAAEWHDWIVTRFPRHVKTSVEWPVAVDRVLGLLRLRAGDTRGGIAGLRRAVAWADSAGYGVEARVSKLQLAEALLHSKTTLGMKEIRALRSPAWSELNEIGIDASRQAYISLRALSLSEETRSPALTKREVQVLALLAEGLTYRDAAERLGISWRTVQLHAYRTYAKLGATGKLQAVDAARELRIL